MPLRAKNKDGILTYIDDAIEGEMYYCQICNQPMMQRHCIDRIDHFAHYSPHGRKDIVPCSDHWGYDKTAWHMEWQKRFPVDSMERVLELHGKKHIADILLSGIVVEFQHSPISYDEFNERNKFYTSLGYKVIWVFDLIEEYKDGRFARNNYDYYYKWSYPKTLFRHILFNTIDVTIYFQLSNSDEPGNCVLERVKEIHDSGRLVKTDSKQCFSIKEFVEKVNEGNLDLFEKPKAPDQIDGRSSIVGLWKENYSVMIIRNKHTSDVFFVFGSNGNIIRDYRTKKIRCKYAYQDSSGYYREKENYYSIPDEEKKIWSLEHAIIDKRYEERQARLKKEEEANRAKRMAELEEINRLKSVEQDDCVTLVELSKESNGRYFYSENKTYFIKIINPSRYFRFFEIDSENRAIIREEIKSVELSKMYRFKLWKKVNID